MRAVVVYESAFGNTREVAEAVADGLSEAAEVEVRPVAETSVEALAGAGLLVVGGPTHIHGQASHRSMVAASEDARKNPDHRFEGDLEGPVLRAWLDGLAKVDGAQAAAFDTRIGKPRLVTGSAAKGIARRLDRHGFDVVAEPESFIVDDMAGPLHEGELERAREWGRALRPRPCPALRCGRSPVASGAMDILRGRVVAIPGAGGSLGPFVARRLAAAGATVSLAGRDRANVWSRSRPSSAAPTSRGSTCSTRQPSASGRSGSRPSTAASTRLPTWSAATGAAPRSRSRRPRTGTCSPPCSCARPRTSAARLRRICSRAAGAAS